MGARYYHPALGRFMAMNPVGFQEGNVHSHNRYTYANNNPYKFVDPDGRSALAIAQRVQQFGVFAIGLIAAANDSVSKGARSLIGLITQDKAVPVAATVTDKPEQPNVGYIRGSDTLSNYTPRPGIDVDGLSVDKTPTPGQKSQMINLSLLPSLNVVAKPHNPNAVTLVPKNPAELSQWAATRPGIINNGNGTPHPLSKEVSNAHIGEVGRNGSVTND